MNNTALSLNHAENGYQMGNELVFDKIFQRAMSFHEPEGIAAVRDESGAYHIDNSGKSIYAARYHETFGYYEGLATVRDDQGFFHINTKGEAIHSNRFLWSGNYQGGLCAVQDYQGFYHVDRDGHQAYSERYSYAGDFRYGIAVVRDKDSAFHISSNGNRLYSRDFLHADVYHKGFAVVEDAKGLYHIDKEGMELYKHRFAYLEPFYNGYALGRTNRGDWIRVQENGHYRHLPRKTAIISVREIFQLISSGHRVGLFLRHSERNPIVKSSWGEEVLLTPYGIEIATKLGARFHGIDGLAIYSSPVERCRQTGIAFADGAGERSSPVESALLGSPGAFKNPDFDKAQTITPENFSRFASQYLQEGFAAGMYPLVSACETLLDFMLQNMKTNLTLYATHDFFCAGLLDFLGLKHLTPEDYVDYLEGVCLVQSANNQYSTYHFCGLREI